MQIFGFCRRCKQTIGSPREGTTGVSKLLKEVGSENVMELTM